MAPAPTRPRYRRAVVSAFGALAALTWGGCTTQVVSPVVELRSLARTVSPRAEAVAPREAWRRAENYAQMHPGCEVLVGSGDSMLPLYHDRTVLVVERMAMDALQSGMTVIFTGESGWPVAHTLMEKTPRGWRTMGLGNGEPDRSTVRFANYIGTVVKAFAPTADATPVQVARGLPTERSALDSALTPPASAMVTLAQLDRE